MRKTNKFQCNKTVIVASENTGEGDTSTIRSENSVGNVIYECMRCGTPVSNEELSKLPEIKCICGFRVFRKARQPIVKQVKAI
ncbi:MAG: hypothetical protein WBL46_02565 [Nitrososphaeraceae archaeon]